MPCPHHTWLDWCLSPSSREPCSLSPACSDLHNTWAATSLAVNYSMGIFLPQRAYLSSISLYVPHSPLWVEILNCLSVLVQLTPSLEESLILHNSLHSWRNYLSCIRSHLLHSKRQVSSQSIPAQPSVELGLFLTSTILGCSYSDLQCFFTQLTLYLFPAHSASSAGNPILTLGNHPILAGFPISPDFSDPSISSCFSLL